MDDKLRRQLQNLVNEVDQIVPRENAVVKMYVDGGAPDESRMAATETGYLRLGIELLKATLEAKKQQGTETYSLPIDLEYLEAEASDVHFYDFLVDEELSQNSTAPVQSRWQKWQAKASEAGLVVFLMLIIGTFITGAITIIVRMISLLKSV